MMYRIKGLLLTLVLAGSLTGCGALVVGGVATGANIAHDRRTAGIVIEDQSIDLKITNDVYAIEEIKQHGHVNVATYNRVVLLTGEVPREQLRRQVEDIARNTPQVADVHNELIVAPASGMAERGTDTWITTKVKTSLFDLMGTYPGFDPTRIKVVTERGEVFLFGLVTPEEASSVIDTVRRVGGVQKVVTLFEYISVAPLPEPSAERLEQAT